MKLVVGLGNPGRKYRGTRHNIGYEVLAAIQRVHGPVQVSNRFQSEICSIAAGSAGKVLLQSPLTYMNLSGHAVREAVQFYRIELGDLLVICDDMNLPTARLRIRASGSAGGQNGLKHIIEQLGTDQFARLRVGVDRPPERIDPSDWVLSRFRSEEVPLIEAAIVRARDAAMVWVESGVSACMNRFNSAAESQSSSPPSDSGEAKPKPPRARRTAGDLDDPHPDGDPG